MPRPPCKEENTTGRGGDVTATGAELGLFVFKHMRSFSSEALLLINIELMLKLNVSVFGG